ncbi:MAG: hypothetical protein PGN13_10170 [Patulibacter minatonensis]
MPFMFDLELPGLTPAGGRALEQAVADAGAWPVRFEPGREEQRWFGIRKAYPSVLEILTEDGRGHILVDPSDWNEDAWVFRPDAVPRLARLVELLADHAPEGYVFRATWSGSPIDRSEELAAVDLAERVRSEAVNDHTRYFVGVDPRLVESARRHPHPGRH